MANTTTLTKLNLDAVDPSWHRILTDALEQVNSSYLDALQLDPLWLPGAKQLFNAFSIPLDSVRYLLLGESPYPRAQSANGFAFWDAAVGPLWSPTGLDKAVNRATSLRNLIKTLLVADGYLSAEDTSQAAIAALDKSRFLNSLTALFQRLLQQGYLLLNASLVLSNRPVKQEARYWAGFLECVLTRLQQEKPDVTLLLFGKVAEQVARFPISEHYRQLIAPHPYNLSFITNPAILNFFKNQQLLTQPPQ